jgi:hypothetical protein
VAVVFADGRVRKPLGPARFNICGDCFLTLAVRILRTHLAVFFRVGGALIDLDLVAWCRRGDCPACGRGVVVGRGALRTRGPQPCCEAHRPKK